MFAAAVALAGCASSDLTDNAEIAGQVAECLPTGTPAPTQVNRAIWYPNSSGFGSVDASVLRPVTGVLALAGDHLWFAAWDAEERHYDVLRSVAVPNAAAVRVSRLGTGAMLVIQSRNNAFDGFELMRKGQFSSDAQAAEDLCARLRGMREKPPDAIP
jgi:hypothetical protein